MEFYFFYQKSSWEILLKTVKNANFKHILTFDFFSLKGSLKEVLLKFMGDSLKNPEFFFDLFSMSISRNLQKNSKVVDQVL